MGDGERYGGGEHRIKELKATLPVHSEMWPSVIIFRFNVLRDPCKWPRSFISASHLGLSNRPQRKEMVSDRQLGPPKAGVRVYTYPPQHRHCNSWEQTPVPLETHA